MILEVNVSEKFIYLQKNKMFRIFKLISVCLLQLMEGGNLLDFGQTGVIAANHVMEDPDGEHEKGAVPTQVQSIAGKLCWSRFTNSC